MVNRNDMIIRIKVDLVQAQQALNKTQAKFKKLSGAAKQAFGRKTLANDIRSVDVAQEKLNKTLGKNVFAGYALSIMFAGMALQAVFTGISKFGIKSFKEINNSVEGSVTEFDKLEGSMKFLGFTIGQALEPVLGFLIPLVDKLGDWIDENESITATIITIGTTLGALMMAGGMLKLAIDGFVTLSGKIGLADSRAGKFFSKLGAAKTIGLGFAIIESVKGVSSLIKGEILSGISSLTKSAGFFAIVGGQKGAAAALFAVGFALQAVDVVSKNGGKLTKEALSKLLLESSPGAFLVNAPIGAAIATVGIALAFLPGDFVDKAIVGLGIIFGTLAQGLAILLDLILFPFITMINGIISMINTLGLGDHERLEQFNLSKAGSSRIDELFGNLASLNKSPGESSQETQSRVVALEIENLNISTTNPAEDILEAIQRAAGGQVVSEVTR